jgi:ribosomal protein L21
VSAVRGPKIRVFKTRKRSQWRRTKGHRQNLHRIRIDGIELPS